MRLSSVFALVLIACGTPRQPRREPARTTPPAKQPQTDPLAGLDRPPEPSEIAPVATAPPSAATMAAATPEHGCVLLEQTPQRLWPHFGPSAALAQGDRFVVAGYAHESADVDTLFLVSTTPGALPSPLHTHRIEPALATARVAPPGIATLGGGSFAVAFVDGAGHVKVAITDLTPSATFFPREVGTGADIRFSPSVAQSDAGLLVAFTDASGGAMRAKVATVAREVAVADVTPQGMGGASPTFASGTQHPELYFVDARAGVSPLVRVVYSGGTPSAGVVARPLGSVSEPVVTRVVRSAGGSFAGYTAIGTAATTAIGIVSLDSADARPRPLVPGTGYGVLQLAATVAPHAALFAVDAPLAPPPESPREVRLRVVDEAGEGPPLSIRGPSGNARSPGIARRADGVIAVTFATRDGVYAAFARCDDQ